MGCCGGGGGDGVGNGGGVNGVGGVGVGLRMVERGAEFVEEVLGLGVVGGRAGEGLAGDGEGAEGRGTLAGEVHGGARLWGKVLVLVGEYEGIKWEGDVRRIAGWWLCIGSHRMGIC